MSIDAREFGLRALEASGCFHAAGMLYRRKVRIMTYHRFGEGYVAGEEFAKQVRFLKKRFSIIDLASYLDRMRENRELPENSVLLTVDDGYEDFYTVAFPILKEHGVPATVFLTVDFLDTGMWLWHDRLNLGLKSTRKTEITLHENHFVFGDNDGRKTLKAYLDSVATRCSPEERDEFVDLVLQELEVQVPGHPTSEYAPLRWDQVVEMSRFGVNFGSHTCTHPILTRISAADCLREMRESKERIEEVLQTEVSAFCYPNGTERDFNESSKKMVEACGYRCAMTMLYGLNDRETDPFALRRMGADGRSFLQFRKDVSGVGEWRRVLRKVTSKRSQKGLG
jgi:peptidoglycan/xylan/chitin deacetylase (PgdA/CDA1 family)